MSDILLRTDLEQDDRFQNVVAGTGAHPVMVLGAIARFWSMGMSQTHNGRFKLLTPEKLDALVSVPGFARNMTEAGWLEVGDDGKVVIPDFAKWFGKSAKTRHQQRIRQSRKRSRDAAKKRWDTAPKSNARVTQQRDESVTVAVAHDAQAKPSQATPPRTTQAKPDAPQPGGMAGGIHANGSAGTGGAVAASAYAELRRRNVSEPTAAQLRDAGAKYTQVIKHFAAAERDQKIGKVDDATGTAIGSLRKELGI